MQNSVSLLLIDNTTCHDSAMSDYLSRSNVLETPFRGRGVHRALRQDSRSPPQRYADESESSYISNEGLNTQYERLHVLALKTNFVRCRYINAQDT